MSELHPETLAVVAGRPPHETDQPLNVPVHLASTFVAGGVAYGRYGNPSWTAFEEVLGVLEGGVAVSFASGMAAMRAVLDLVPSGGLVVAPQHSYTGTAMLLEDGAAAGNLRVRYVDISDTDAVTAAVADAAMLWIESPTNPALEVADIEAIAAAAHAAGAKVVVDNTFATPILQKPLTLGADIVVHSATKYISGHSDVVMGAVVTDAETADAVRGRRSLTGAIPSAMEAFLALRGLRTLPLRVQRAQETAAELARRLDGHPALSEVRYPGFGGIVSIVLAGGADAADALVESTDLWIHATSLGGVESTFERRRRWPAERETIPEGLVRLAVGLEQVDDLHADLVQALDAVAAR